MQSQCTINCPRVLRIHVQTAIYLNVAFIRRFETRFVVLKQQIVIEVILLRRESIMILTTQSLVISPARGKLETQRI